MAVWQEGQVVAHSMQRVAANRCCTEPGQEFDSDIDRDLAATSRAECLLQAVWSKAYLTDHIVQEPEGRSLQQCLCKLWLIHKWTISLQQPLSFLPEVFLHCPLTRAVKLVTRLVPWCGKIRTLLHCCQVAGGQIAVFAVPSLLAWKLYTLLILPAWIWQLGQSNIS